MRTVIISEFEPRGKAPLTIFGGGQNIGGKRSGLGINPWVARRAQAGELPNKKLGVDGRSISGSASLPNAPRRALATSAAHRMLPARLDFAANAVSS